MLKQKMVDETNLRLIQNACVIQRRIDKIMTGRHKLLIFGAGETTKYLLLCCDLSAYSVRICANGSKKDFMGHKVEMPDRELLDWADRILISAFSEQTHRSVRLDLEKLGVDGKRFFGCMTV